MKRLHRKGEEVYANLETIYDDYSEYMKWLASQAFIVPGTFS